MIRTLALFALFVASAATTWDVSFANRTIWFSSAAYCDRETYLSRTWLGPTSGFQATKVIYDRKTDTNGYVGYLPSTKEIYVVFRGSQTLKNWITNLQFAKADYDYPLCSGCLVHKGFFEAEQVVLDDVVKAVNSLSSKYNTKKVVSTGHSLGAALSTLTALDLKRLGYDVYVYNIGCPRVGNADLAAYAARQLPDFHRIVHNNDMVPQIPLQSMNFHHVAYEYFEDENHNVRRCDASGEDASCSDQYSLIHTSVDAHSLYLNEPVSCEHVSTAREAELHRMYMERVESERRLEARMETGGLSQFD